MCDVIVCKDCKYSYGLFNLKPNEETHVYVCRHPNMYKNEPHKDDFYCGYAESKQNDTVR